MADSGALRELLAFIGFDVDDKELKKADRSIDKTLDGARKLGEALAAAFAVHELAGFVEGQIEAGAHLAHTSDMLGIATDDLQAFQYAAATAGIATDEATTSLGFLNKAIGEAGAGNAEVSQTFAKLKVTLKAADGSARPLADVISDVADGFAKLPNQGAKTVTAMQLFGRAGRGMIPILNKGSAGIRELYGEFQTLGGGLEKDFIAQAEEAEHETVKFKTALHGLESTIAGPLLSALSPMVDDLIDGAKYLRDMAKHTPIVTTAMWSFATVSAVLVALWAAANIEIFLAVAAIALLALGVEDFVGFLEGKDSVIGDFLDDLGGKGTSQNARDFIKSLYKDFTDIVDEVENDLVPAVLQLWDSFKSEDSKKEIHDVRDALSSAAEVARDLAQAVATVAHWAAEASRALAALNIGKKDSVAAKALDQSGIPGGSSTVRNALGGIGDVVSFAGRHLLGGIPAAIGDLGQSTGFFQKILGPGTGGGGGDLTSHASVTITNNINGGDPKAITLATQDGVSDGIIQANNAAFAGIGGGGAP